MKNVKVLSGIALVAAAVALTYLLPQVTSRVHLKRSFPPAVCSGIPGDGVTTAYLSSSKIGVRPILGKSVKFAASGSRNVVMSKNSLLVDGGFATSVLTTSQPGRWLGSTICSASSGDQWFVGGSGEITSKARLNLVNSGLSDSTVGITVFTAHQSAVTSTVVVSSNSSRQMSLDSLAPGESSLVVHVLAQSGRMSAFLFDQRTKGLSSLGMDYVNPVNEPTSTVTIPMVLSSPGKGQRISHFLRLLAPGNLDANAKVTIISSDGSYTPIGFDDLVIHHGKVIDLPLTSISEVDPFSIVVASDQPIVAGVRSQISGSGTVDFAWSTPAPILTNNTFNLGGYSPQLVFTGSNFKVKIAWISTSGSTGNETVSGDQIGFWQPKNPLFQISISPKSEGVRGGMIFLNTKSGSFGLSYLPMLSGSTVQAALLPVKDAHVISRG